MVLRWRAQDDAVVHAAALRGPSALAAILSPPGPAGPRGLQGVSAGEEKVQALPAANWTFPHALGRLPNAAVYLASGEQVDAEIFATNSSVTVTFGAAVAGRLILT